METFLCLVSDMSRERVEGRVNSETLMEFEKIGYVIARSVRRLEVYVGESIFVQDRGRYCEKYKESSEQ